MSRPFLLLSNDDGVHAPGLRFLIRTLLPVADLLVVAPDAGRSGAGCSFTASTPLRCHELERKEGLIIASCSGTPVDCIKMALALYPERRPDLVVSGINRSDNSSVNTHYSGTMGAATEGALQGFPAIAFSILDHREDADFTPLAPYLVDFVFKAIAIGLPPLTCLNINFPKRPAFQGVRICRMAHSRWEKEVEAHTDPHGRAYYWLGGYSHELEPERN